MKAEKQHKVQQASIFQPKRGGSKFGFVDNRPLAILQRQQKDNIHAKSVLQRNTNITHNGTELSFGDAKCTVGANVFAHLDPEDVVVGSEPGAGEQVSFIKVLNKFFRTSFLRGHLLNADLGGPGLDYNLFPISYQANTDHSNLVETPLKLALNRAKREHMDIDYSVAVEDVHALVNGDQIGDFASTFVCNANYVQKPNTNFESSIIPPNTKIISNITKSLPVGHRRYFPISDDSMAEGGARPLEEWKHQDKGKTPNYIETSGGKVGLNGNPVEEMLGPERLEDAFNLFIEGAGDTIIHTIISKIEKNPDILHNLYILKSISDIPTAKNYLSKYLETNEVPSIVDLFTAISSQATEDLNQEEHSGLEMFYDDKITELIVDTKDRHLEEIMALFGQETGNGGCQPEVIADFILEKMKEYGQEDE